MVAYTYSRVAALNFNTTPPTVAKSGTGSVYAKGDTTFTTPLNVTMVVGGLVTTSLSSDANGFFPDFDVDNRTSVVWKQNGSSFTTVLTTTDPVPGEKGDPGDPGAAGAKGDRGDLATWEEATFYPLNQVIANPSGDLVKVTTAHTSGVSYDATKFGYVIPPGLVTKGSIRLNVKDYGAVGNGTTEDYAAIAATLAAAKVASANGTSSEVYFPAGNYKVSTELNIDASNIEFVGDGNSTQITLNGVSLKINGTAGLIMFNGIRNMRIFRSGTAGVAVAIVGGGASSGNYPVRWHLDNVHIGSLGGTGLRLAGTFLGAAYNLYIRNAVTGLLIDYDDSLGNLSANAINFHGGEIQAVENIGTISGGIGISFFGTSLEGASVSGLDVRAACRGITITGCYIEANNSYDVRVGENGQVYAFSLTGCYFNPGVYGPKERAIILRTVYGVDIRANYFYGYSASPVLVNETGAGLVTGATANNHNSVGANAVTQVQAGTVWNRPVFGTRATVGDGTGASALYLNGASGTSRQAAVQTAGLNRWIVNLGSATAESGSNAGTNVEFLAYNDAGTLIGTALSLNRASRLTRAHANLTVDGSSTLTGGATTPADVEVTDTASGIILKSPNGTRYRIGVADDGALTTTSL